MLPKVLGKVVRKQDVEGIKAWPLPNEELFTQPTYCQAETLAKTWSPVLSSYHNFKFCTSIVH
jgi:hypothetical protein